MNEIITSKDNAKVKEAFKAKEAEGDLFVAEGFHLVEMALESGAAIRIFALKDYEAKVPVFRVNEEIIRKLSSTQNPEGIVALCAKKAALPFRSTRLLYLDEVADPGNLGTLLRTALAFGFSDVLLSLHSADPYKSKCLLASQGALFKLNVQTSTKTKEEDAYALKDAGYTLIATDLKSAVAPSQIVTQNKKIALILGNEARGVAPQLIALSEQSVRIEMSGIDSLNVGVAGGILMYELRER